MPTQTLELNSTTLLNDTNLKAYYRMEGNSNDTKGTQNGTDTGSPVYSAGSGLFGQGVLFDANTKYITVTNAAFQFSSSSAFSISCWVNQSSYKVGGYIWGQEATSGKFGYALHQDNVNGYINFECDKAFVAGYITTSTTVCTSGSWFHIVGTFDGATHMILYINGAQDSTATFGGGAVAAGDGATLIGNDSGDLTNRNYLGKLDDLAVFNRVLTAQEVADLYWGSMGTASTNSLVRYRRTRYPGSITGL